MKIFITGGSSGIGAAIVDLLSKDGHEVTFTYFKNKNSHSDLKNCKGLFFDLNSEDSLKEITDHIKTSEYDALVNNLCTVPAREKFLKMQPSDFMDYILINLKSALLLSQVFSESLKKRSNSGSIVNILSSVTLGMPPAEMSSYITLKYALLGFTKSLAAELSRNDIRVNAVSPSMTKTDFISEIDERAIEMIENSLPMKRLAKPDEVSGIVKFLLSPEASYINGANIPVTGGSIC